MHGRLEKETFTIIASYKQKCFYDDKTGFFFKGTPTKSLVLKSCIREENAKDRLTVFICGNMNGELRKPLVIGKF